MNNFDKFLGTYAGAALLKKHHLNEAGIWQVRGEDPNCDFGGHHHMPYLGTYEGKLGDVISIAVDLPGFWTWGGGGDITRISLIKAPTGTFDADSWTQRKKKRDELSKAEAQVAALKKELGLK